jgi:hypothetical protein
MMTASTERMLKIRTAELGGRLAKTVKNVNGKVAAKTVAGPDGDRKQDAKLLTQELDVLRRSHAKLQQAIFEAAQVQRKLSSRVRERFFRFATFRVIFSRLWSSDLILE